MAISDFLMAADILHNIAVLRGQIAAQAAEDPSLLRIAARRGVDLSALGEAGSAAAAEWQRRGSSSESGDDDSLARRARALRDDFANRRRRDTLGGYPHPRTLPPPPPQHSPLSRSRLSMVSTRPIPPRQHVINSLEAMNQASGMAAREHHERAARNARSRVRFPNLEYELVEQDERDEQDEGDVSDDASSSMLSQILSIR